ncbi:TETRATRICOPEPTIDE-LIKE HELICAL DOMAIN-CONTAINING PROTEIN-RELATED [Salix purpurea]|uniref:TETRATRICOPEPTIDE-LIKE HELICAL DOMAIN-CONTAINING PROTEIN-RELATED n=1 Tax=Salix purpurea TaxID=77065 RepID=A0A9Q1AG03_SALPP|nr:TETRATRICOPEPTIDE-LIKE HELICAL DOMAIN-CONTAINING PROTEIN-RELATED [Salix purpurea]
MKTLIFINPINCTAPQSPPSIYLFHFQSLSRENKKSLLHISHSKNPLFTYKPRLFSPIKASASDTYNGWHDLGLIGGDSVDSGESTQLRNFLVSIGIDDKKHVFMFVLGIFCALAISRVRVSSIIVFPASVLVFAVGFSFGFVRGGSFNEFNVNAIKRKAKEEFFRVYSERLRSLVGFFDGFDVEASDLKNDIQRAIDSKEIKLGDLENYVNVIHSIKVSALNARNVVEANIVGAGNVNGVLVENQKSSSSSKGKEIGEVGFEFLKFVGGLFGEKAVSSRTSKVKEKEIAKQGTVKGAVNFRAQGNNLTPVIEEEVLNAADNEKANRDFLFSQGSMNKSSLNLDSQRRIRIVSENGKVNLGDAGGDGKRLVNNEEYLYQNNRLQFMDNHDVYWKMDQNNETETWKSQDNPFDSVDFGVSLEQMETETSFVQKQMYKKSSGAYRSSHTWKMSEDERYRSQLKEGRVNDDLHLGDHQSVPESEVVSSSSSVVTDDVVFDRHLTEANNLLKQAKEFLRGRSDEEYVEIILHKSAKLLSKAIAMKPMSLLAVGQLGNTYLLHGELKLKISRELRTRLSRRDPFYVNDHGGILKGLDDQVIKKDKIASVLVNVCEECEELLVEAGRKYRLALSIDGNDVRALYNWGLALSFRAQLIADIGPEAAYDADKVFLAAIDKFDAMMSKGNVYAPDALYRWGVVLQQRSRLRPTNSREKVKLLQQARRLYEDALHMDSNNLQVREALLSCMSELNHRLL